MVVDGLWQLMFIIICLTFKDFLFNLWNYEVVQTLDYVNLSQQKQLLFQINLELDVINCSNLQLQELKKSLKGLMEDK